MNDTLRPRTDAGRKAVELAEQHASEVRARAAEHDRDGTFPYEAIDAMKASGFLTAGVPQEFGGGGVSSIYDLMVATNRLGRADGSLAIAVNMHFSVVLIVCRLLRGARERGEGAVALEEFLGALGSGFIAMANATESGTDVRHPMTEVTRVEGGWRVDGHKTFGTLSPVADIMIVPARMRRDDGTYGSGTAIVFRGTPGQTILDNWDALGMRGSGSNDVVYENWSIQSVLGVRAIRWPDEGKLIGTGPTWGLLGALVGTPKGRATTSSSRRSVRVAHRPVARRAPGHPARDGRAGARAQHPSRPPSWIGMRGCASSTVGPVGPDGRAHELMAGRGHQARPAARGDHCRRQGVAASGGAGYLSANRSRWYATYDGLHAATVGERRPRLHRPVARSGSCRRGLSVVGPTIRGMPIHRSSRRAGLSPEGLRGAPTRCGAAGAVRSAYHTYWFDPANGSVFCLAEGPVKAVGAHLEARRNRFADHRSM
jgi:hypothetical protein